MISLPTVGVRHEVGRNLGRSIERKEGGPGVRTTRQYDIPGTAIAPNENFISLETVFHR
jgi:hypothetical protein